MGCCGYYVCMGEWRRMSASCDQRNKLTLSCFGKREPGCDLLFGPDSRDNTIFALSLPNGVTNRAAVPSDKVIPNWPIGFDIETPPVPARGDFLVNRT